MRIRIRNTGVDSPLMYCEKFQEAAGPLRCQLRGKAEEKKLVTSPIFLKIYVF
jgi:hypothetical protein